MSKVYRLLTIAVVTAIVSLAAPHGVQGARGGANRIAKMSVRSTGATTEIFLHGTRPATFSAYRQASPPRVVLELANTVFSGSKGPIAVDSWSVSQVAHATLDGKRGVKVIVTLAKRGTYQVVSQGKVVKISVTALQPFPEASTKASEKLALLKKEAARTELRLKRARAMAKALEAKTRSASKVLKTTKAERAEMAETLASSKRAIRELIREREAMAKAVKAAKKRVAIYRAEEQQAMKRYRAILARTEQLNKQRLAKLSKIKALSRKIAREEARQAQLRATITEYKSQIDSLAKAISWKKRTGRKVGKKLQRRLAQLKAALRSRKGDLNKTQDSIADFRRSQSTIRRLKAAEEAKLAKLRASVAHERNKLSSQIGKLKATTAKLSTKRASLLKELSTLNQRKERVRALFEREQALTEKITKARIRAERVRRRIRSLTADEGKKAKIAKEKATELAELVAKERKDLNTLKRSKSMEQSALANLKRLRAEHKKMLTKERRRLAQLRREGKRAQEAALRQRQAQRVASINKIARTARSWERRVASSKKSLEGVTSRIKSAKNTLERVRQSYQSTQLELARLARDKDLARSALFKTKAALESTRLRNKEERRVLARLRKSTRTKLVRFKKVSRRLSTMERKLSSLGRKRALKETELKALSSEADSLRDKVRQSKEEIRVKRAAIATLEKRRKTLLASIRTSEKRSRKVLQQKLADLETRRARLSKEITHMEKRRELLAAQVVTTAGVSARSIINNVEFVDSPWSHQVVLTYKGGRMIPQTLHKGKVLTVRIPSARLRHDLRRKMDTAAYKGPIVQFLTWNKVTKDKGEAILQVNTRGIRKAEVRRRKGKLIVLVPKTIAEVRQFKKSSRTVHPTRVAGYLSTTRAAAARLPSAPKAKRYRPYRSKRSRKSSGRRYYGRFVDLDFKDADIHNVIRLVAEVWGRNVVIPDSVKGSVTIKLTNVRVDRAFDVILKSKGLSWNYEGGNIIRVITSDQRQKEREEMMARTKTKVRLIKTQTRLIPINYASAKDIAKAIQDNVKSKRGKVTFDKRTNVIIYVDIPSKLSVAQKLIRSLDLPTPQVQIEARIVEAESTFLREIGVQWGGSLLASSATGNPTGLIFPSNIGIAGGNMDNVTNSGGVSSAGAANPDFAVNLPASTGQGSGGAMGMTLGSLAGAVNINLRLSAMEEIGHVRSIAAPKITTLDNVKATISQGVEIPYPQSSAQGNTVIMKQAVLSLSVTPHVTNDNMVKMKIQVTKDEPDETHRGADGSLGIAKKSADTELLVKSGDTAVIGGIYKRQSTLVYRKVPWFADIPILGWLFKSQYKKDSRSELLIFITPRVLNRSGIISKQ